MTRQSLSSSMISLLCLAIVWSIAIPAKAEETVTVQLKWLHHFQFAGYYAALEKGFYKDAGLNVILKEGGATVEVEQEVASGRADVGIGTSALLLHRAQGHDFVVLGQVFQHSAAVLMTPRSTGIRSIADMAGRRFMYSNQHGDILALLKKNGIDPSKIATVPHQGDPHDLLTGKADVMVAYSINEPYVLESKGEPYLTFSPLSSGIDFYGDNFFVTRKFVEARPEVARAFREATLRGWRYALSNKGEIADLILAKYSKEKNREWLMFEAHQAETLIQPDLVELGYQSETRWKRIAETFSGVGLLPAGFNASGIIYDPTPHRGYRFLLVSVAVCAVIIVILVSLIVIFRHLNVRLHQEIAERRNAEEALRGSEGRLREIFDTSHAGILLGDPDGIITFANSRMAEMFGYCLDEFTGLTYVSLVHPDQRQESMRGLARMIAGEIPPASVERHYIRKDGTDFWGHLTARRGEAENGSLHHIVVVITDITERKLAKEALLQSEAKFRSIVEASPSAMHFYRLDAEGALILTGSNPAADSITGDVKQKLLNKPLQKAFPGFSDTHIPALFRQVARGEIGPQSLEISYEDGGFRGCFDLHVYRTGPDAIAVHFMDITERENIRLELLKTQKLESVGVLAGGIAHDFNNIITSILANISYAQKFLDPSHRAFDLLEGAQRGSLRAADLANRLLTFSKGHQPVKEAVSARQVVEASVSLGLSGSNTRSVIELSDSVSPIEVDEGQICQAFNNIIINAVQAMPEGGVITISAENCTIPPSATSAGGDYVRFTFTDIGCGIAEDDLKKIFDPYFTTKPQGNGLGLASVHSIISKHGGSISVQSVVGKGTTFQILLPAAGLPAEPAAAATSTVPMAMDGKSLLIMDDEEDIRDITGDILSSLGYRVQTCVDGHEAVSLYAEALAAGNPFSGVIMDLTIPGGMGGKEAAQHILRLHPEARLIVSSGYSNDPVIADYKRYGFAGWVTKPYTDDDIAAVVASIM